MGLLRSSLIGGSDRSLLIVHENSDITPPLHDILQVLCEQSVISFIGGIDGVKLVGVK